MIPEVSPSLSASRALRSSCGLVKVCRWFQTHLEGMLYVNRLVRGACDVSERFARTQTRSGGSLKGSSEPGDVPIGS